MIGLDMWADYRSQIISILGNLVVTTGSGEEMAVDSGFAQWVTKTTGMPPGHSLHLIGNGASASMASHFCADITKNCGIRANVFTDAALITALGNDNSRKRQLSETTTALKTPLPWH